MLIRDAINNTKITNQNFELYKENDEYYLRMDFDYEDDYGVYKGHINNIKFDFYLKEVDFGCRGTRRKATVKLVKPSEGYHNPISFDAHVDSDGNLFTFELVKEKVHEVTMEEIEKKFGHKIKIVSKKGE